MSNEFEPALRNMIAAHIAGKPVIEELLSEQAEVAAVLQLFRSMFLLNGDADKESKDKLIGYLDKIIDYTEQSLNVLLVLHSNTGMVKAIMAEHVEGE